MRVPFRRSIARGGLNIGSKTKRFALPLSRISNPTMVRECPVMMNSSLDAGGGMLRGARPEELKP